jgi:transketolase
MVERALAVAEDLAGRGVEARVLNMATVHPLDRQAIASAARETRAIVTVEEHTVHGGLGSAVAEVVVATHPVPVKMLGFPGVFAPTGPASFILEHFGLTSGGIRDATLELLETGVRLVGVAT